MKATTSKRTTPIMVRILTCSLLVAGSLLANPSPVHLQEQSTQSVTTSSELDEARSLHAEAEKLFDTGRFASGVSPAQRALELREKALGPNHADVAATLNLLGKLHRKLAKFAVAESLFQRALTIREKTLGLNHADTAETFNDLGEVYIDKLDLAQAESLFMRSMLIYSKVKSQEDPDLATPTNNLGIVYVLRGDLMRGEQLCVGAMNIRQLTLPGEHRRMAESLDTVGSLFLFRGDLNNAEQFLGRALSVREKVLGPDHPDVADTLSTLAEVYLGRTDFSRAESTAARALSIREKMLGADHPEYASSLIQVGTIASVKGDLKKAEQNIQRAVSIREKALGIDHLLVANALQELAKLKVSVAEAEPLAMRALAIREKTFGLDHVIVADSLNFLANLAFVKGDFMQAKMHYWRSLSIREKTLGPMHPLMAESLLGLATVLAMEGNSVHAEPLNGRAVNIYETVFGTEHPTVAFALDKLADTLNAKGDFGVSEQILRRALAIREKAFGPDHFLVAQSLNNLGLTLYGKGDLTGAEPLFRRALDILEKAPVQNQASVISILNNLGTLCDSKGDLEQADSLLRRAQKIADSSPTPNELTTPELLNNRAKISVKRGNYTEAETLFAKALTIYETRFGADHPSIASVLNNMAELYLIKGENANAAKALSRADEVREHNLSLMFSSGSERQKFVYLQALLSETSFTVTFHTRFLPSDQQALRLSFRTILRRKGRTLDTMTDQFASLRRRARKGELGSLGMNDFGVLEQLSTTQSQLSSLMLAGRGSLTPEQYQLNWGQLNLKLEQLQDYVSRSAGNLKQQSVTIEQVQQALPPDSALVEFFSYGPVNLKPKLPSERFGPVRYVAYVLPAKGEPLWTDLGAVAEIDHQINSLLTAIRCPQTGVNIKECPTISDVKDLARNLDEKVMRPVRKLLGNTRHVFLSPDGTLNLLPFVILVDVNQKYLIENYSFTYLTSGRDLLRLRQNVESKELPVIMADPAFSTPGQTGVPPITTASPLPGNFGLGPVAPLPGITTANRSVDLTAVNFGPLFWSANEAKALASLMPDARVFTQDRASEPLLKQVHGPSILHIATHGFFLPDQSPAPAESTSGLRMSTEGQNFRLLVRSENPLLRSGLALAGANLPPAPNSEDGILTALEAAGLDLSGTKLVVLSACDTGLGAITLGEGVYGLRRALVLAGSESQVISLWQVSDEGTRNLMIDYYERLIAGAGRTEALRQAQLQVLRGSQQKTDSTSGQATKADYRHPFYWAAFIQSGDWRAMNIKPVSSPMKK